MLYDSEQQEITALLFSGEDLYAAATSARRDSGRDEIRRSSRRRRADLSSGPMRNLPAAVTKTAAAGRSFKLPIPKSRRLSSRPEHKGASSRPPRPARASFIYKVTKDGFVTDIFNETAVFFCLAESRKELLVGTGNERPAFSVEPNSEEQAIIYEDRQASQITAVVASGDDVYVGMANPAKLIKLGKVFAREGTYTSELVDAGQPAKWGKLQIEADVPADCNVLVGLSQRQRQGRQRPEFFQMDRASGSYRPGAARLSRWAGSASINLCCEQRRPRQPRLSGKLRWPRPCRIWRRG